MNQNQSGSIRSRMQKQKQNTYKYNFLDTKFDKVLDDRNIDEGGK